MVQLVHFSRPDMMYDNVLMLDVAERFYRNGDDVKILVCDSTINICTSNYKAEKVICEWCKFYRKKLFKNLSENIEILYYRDFFYERNKNSIDNINFAYDSIENIKDLTYKNVKIGYSALSSYVSISRNINPKIDNAFKTYFDLFLKSQCILIEILDSVLDTIHPDLVSLYNGRFFDNRPVFEYSRSLGYHVRSYETKENTKFENFSMTFGEDVAIHNIKYTCNWINKIWDETNLVENEKTVIGESFFYNRRNVMFAGGDSFVKNQKQGILPGDWNASKRNIAIFLSSEDEFFATGEDFDEGKLFSSQKIGIIKILNHFKDNMDFHFYLRIHPNLKNIKYRYHTSLVELEIDYDNITVIGAGDKISTYTLLDHTEKTIVFGSTMGVEACYWKKPVILLNPSFYQYLNICYRPENIEKAMELIEDGNLPVIDPSDAIKYGFFVMFNYGEDCCYYDFHIHLKPIKILKKNIMLLNHNPVKYSLFTLYLLRKILSILNKIFIKTGIEMPIEESDVE
ncbi:hypothetical protein FACS1894137_01110 [Spirochaetia bacterium]|nr:hypothetical protein FACS1894137_01110 [Spirochaetia bacterium]